jgi:hypothetical protein
MEQKIYLYDKEKDTTLEGCISELSTMTDEERVAYFEKLSVEERKELYSYMKWQAAAERSKRLYLEAEQEFLKKQREQLMKEREDILRSQIDEAISILDICEKSRIFNNLGEA